MNIDSILGWIEQHPVTIEMVQWAALLLVAWLSGVFRLLRRYKRRCRLEVSSPTSRCFVEELEEFDGQKQVMRVAFLIDATVTNPTNEKAVIERFALSYQPEKIWPPFLGRLYAITMPSRPRSEMGGATKLSKVFFSIILDGFEGTTMDGILESKQFQSGYLLFVSFTWGSWNPRVTNDEIRIKVEAKLTSGEVVKDTVWVKVNRDKERFNNWVPGIVEHISHESAWTSFY